MYPDPNNRTKWLPSASTTVKYYCIRKSCVVDRFPYFNASFVKVPPSTKDKLLASHVKILREELELAIVHASIACALICMFGVVLYIIIVPIH